MVTKRILSIILTVMMVFTLFSPLAVFAEELEAQDQGREDETEVVDTILEIEGFEEGNHQIDSDETEANIIEQYTNSEGAIQDNEQEGIYEQTEEELPLTDQELDESLITIESDSEEASSEIHDDEAALVSNEETEPDSADSEIDEGDALVTIDEQIVLFDQGYVCVKAHTEVFNTESKRTVKGSFSTDAIVYATVTNHAEDESESWLRIVFDTTEAKETNGEVLTGYVQMKSVRVLTDEEIVKLTNDLDSDTTARKYLNRLLPIVSFVSVSEEYSEIVCEAESETTVLELDMRKMSSFETNGSIIPPEIDAQPTTAEAAIGDTVTFTVASANAASYQWQYSVSGTKWNNIRESNAYFSGGTTNTLSFTLTQTYSTWSYKCILTNEGGSVETAIVGVTVVEPTITIEGVVYRQISDGEVEIVGYEGSATSLLIPTTIDFNGVICTVTEVGKEAFYNNTVLTSISLPNTIIVINEAAFCNCSSLYSMTCHD